MPSPTQAKDFHPISCCTTIYKCITKLLCWRLKEVLPHLIQEQQGAFVKGRELLFNVLICEDITRGYSRTGISPHCTIKLDIHKAFDSVHWSFIKDLLNHLRFPQQLVSWVMACLHSVSYIMQMNGQQGKEFIGGRGLKQGDPLSSVLFVLSMEYLTRMLKLASLQPGFSFHP